MRTSIPAFLLISSLFVLGNLSGIQSVSRAKAAQEVLLQPMDGSGPGLEEEQDAEVVQVKAQDQKLVLGWIENIRMLPNRTLLKAKLDSGAKSSALHADNIEYFESDGRDMVRFTMLSDHQDPDSEHFVYERPLVREVNIKLRYTSVRDERPAVRLQFCLAGKVHNTLFTLTTRADFNYPVLLGREFLQHNILVDSNQSFTQRTRCPQS